MKEIERKCMRTLILAITMLFALSATSIAASNGDLYKDYKVYADNSFKMKPESTSDITCHIYFAASRDFSNSVCTKYADEKDLPAHVKATLRVIRKKFRAGGNHDPNTIDASIQHYVNEMAKKPEA
ncbi:hypothetical protein OAQ37_01400 [Alphaproteobacteria bacterium]|nr:hypothetical protein [Alphaproteobacteria bacterium]